MLKNSNAIPSLVSFLTGMKLMKLVKDPNFINVMDIIIFSILAGGVATGWQVVLRSKNIYGPYEWKTVLTQGETKINGPHQGAWVDTTTGEDWFLHFQDVGAHGRLHSSSAYEMGG